MFRVTSCPYCQKRLMSRHVGPLILGAEDLVPDSNVYDRSIDDSMDSGVKSAQTLPVQATVRARAQSMDMLPGHLKDAAPRNTRVESLSLGKILWKMNLLLI